MTCEMCRNDAKCCCIWGLYEYNYTDPLTQETIHLDQGELTESYFCKEHSDELWKKIHCAVNAGMMHFIIKKV